MLVMIRSQGESRPAISTCSIAFGESSWSLHTVYVYVYAALA
jgi:hypothetical protein